MTMDSYITLGMLVALIERLATKYGISLPYPSLATKAAGNPIYVVQPLVQVTKRCTADERDEIGELVDRLDFDALKPHTPNLAAQGVLLVAERQGKSAYGLSKVAIGQTLQELREQHGMSQSDAARACGVTRQYWGRVEGGDSQPRSDTLRKIAQGFGLDYPALLDLIRAHR